MLNVAAAVDTGKTVVFGPTGGCIQESGPGSERVHMSRRGNAFYLVA